MLVTFVWMPLGARDAAGVSSVLPALRPVALAQPAGAVARPGRQRRRRGAVPRPTAPCPVAAAILAASAAVLVAAVVGGRGSPPDPGRRAPPPSLAALADRAPPLVP